MDFTYGIIYGVSRESFYYRYIDPVSRMQVLESNLHTDQDLFDERRLSYKLNALVWNLRTKKLRIQF